MDTNSGILLCRWCDNRVVHLISTHTGVTPMENVTRYDRKAKQTVTINSPIVKVYNKFMGGIDLLDSLSFLYKHRMKCHRWYIYIWHHTLHIAVVNAWLLYRRHSEQIRDCDRHMPLKEFQMSIAESLILRDRRVGRTSFIDHLSVSRKRPFVSAPVQPEVRYDLLDHFPIFAEKRSRCKLCPAGAKNGFTYIKCGKCQVFLCLNRERNCFYEFHHKS